MRSALDRGSPHHACGIQRLGPLLRLLSTGAKYATRRDATRFLFCIGEQRGRGRERASAARPSISRARSATAPSTARQGKAVGALSFPRKVGNSESRPRCSWRTQSSLGWWDAAHSRTLSRGFVTDHSLPKRDRRSSSRHRRPIRDRRNGRSVGLRTGLRRRGGLRLSRGGLSARPGPLRSSSCFAAGPAEPPARRSPDGVNGQHMRPSDDVLVSTRSRRRPARSTG